MHYIYEQDLDFFTKSFNKYIYSLAFDINKNFNLSKNSDSSKSTINLKFINLNEKVVISPLNRIANGSRELKRLNRHLYSAK